MAQQLPSDYPIDPTVTSGTALADILNRTNEVLNSNNSGPTRPSTVKAGGLWTKTGGAALELYLFDGTTDIFYSAIGPAGPQGPAGAPGATGPAGPNAVSSNAGNYSKLGTDNLIFTPTPPYASETVAGLVELATAAEAQGLADTLRAITPRTLADAFLGGNISGNTAGFQRLPSGLMLQWASGGSSSPLSEHIFPVAFKTAVFNIQVTRIDNVDVTAFMYVYDFTLASFRVREYDTSPNFLFWLAIGT